MPSKHFHYFHLTLDDEPKIKSFNSLRASPPIQKCSMQAMASPESLLEV